MKIEEIMEILLVDDYNPTGLNPLENLLHKCKHNVTTVDRTTAALKLLRENNNKFDLVICDVENPASKKGFDMLQGMGKKMDLPVLMLSSPAHKDIIMMRIAEGVRTELLMNIWQNVRKKLNSEQGKNSDKALVESGEVRVEFKGTENVDHNSKPNRKRKYRNNEDYEEKGQDHDDPSTKKKPRFVWTPELHEKFVAAVETLGVDQAVPKRILELMNDGKITRENVASHLQKYRQLVKKNSQINNIGSDGSAQGPILSEVDNARDKSRLGLGARSSSRDVRQGRAHSLMNTIGHEPNIHSSIQTGNRSHNMAYGTTKFNSVEQNKDLIPVAENSNMYLDSSSHSVYDNSSYGTFNVNSARNFGFASNSNNILTAPRGDGNRFSTAAAPSSSDFSFTWPNFGGYHGNWPNTIPFAGFHDEQSPLLDLRDHTTMLPANVGRISSHEVFSFNSVANAIPDITTYSQYQARSIVQIAGRNMNQNRILNQGVYNQSSQTLGPENALLVPSETSSLCSQISGFHMNNDDFDFVRETNLDDVIMEPIGYSEYPFQDLPNLPEQDDDSLWDGIQTEAK